MSLSTLRLSTPQLRRVLALDAIAGAGTAVLHLAFAGSLAGWLGLSEGLITAAGWALLAYIALAAILARQVMPARGPLMVLIVGNVLWGVACLVLAWGGDSGVTALGQAYLTVLAVAVLALADLEFLGWRAPVQRLAV
ncbi:MULTISPECIES: hypothetical protein [unclassified Hydrogenophaga]|uniref:hypothetical protein n=1 Tax=unclassified Hydrogenophaga TaxID=2610897 RepID=UPI000878E5E0|nr:MULTISPECIES: hypothetical protein [unclassified Hydrogenophaga]MBN9369499.1 hypothetical protein [Hydrogenophaga sp.]OJV47853.1 MAG: hypothetical protein BGO22_07330 [Hydrogenophaga sp. 70-12]